MITLLKLGFVLFVVLVVSMLLFGTRKVPASLNAPQPAVFQCGCYYCTAPNGWLAKQCEGHACCTPESPDDK